MRKILVDGQTLSTPEMRRGIGMVFARLLAGMAAADMSTAWFVAVRDEAALRGIPAELRALVEPVVLPALAAEGDAMAWGRRYGTQLQEVVDRLRPEWYWNPNPLMPNVHFPYGLRGTRTAWTVHDLIPCVFPQWYLDRWPQSVSADYLARLEALASGGDVIFADSHATVSDLRSRHPACEARIEAVHLGYDEAVMRPLAFGGDEEEAYVLYVGGFDPRKNMDMAMRAFARFRASLPSGEAATVELKIVAADSGAEADAARTLAASLGIGDALELTGFVEDEALGRLHRGARIFFFPSLYEGFGLPVVDALASGVPVVCSNSSSLPEVCGPRAFLASPGDLEGLAAALCEAWRQRLERPGPWLENVAHAAASFRWGAAARAYLAVLAPPRTSAPAAPVGGDGVALLSPWPPDRNGIAQYSFHLAGHLARHGPLTVFTAAENPTPLEGVRVRPLAEFEGDAERYPVRFYHLGNGAAHREIYRLANAHPGVIVVHDYNINPFLVHFALLSGDAQTYREALEHYGEPGIAAWKRYETDGTIPSTWEFPMMDRIASRSAGAVVHSRWVARRLRDVVRVEAAQLGVDPQPAIDDQARLAAKIEAGLDPRSHYVGAFGFVNAHKRPSVVAAAVGLLRAEGYPVRLLLVGEALGEGVDIAELRRHSGLGEEDLIHTGFVSDAEFRRLLAVTDVLVNLRYPSMGESSASLLHAMASGVPSIVSEVGPFTEIPSDAVWKVPVDDDEVAILAAYLRYLLGHPDARTQLGARGREFVERQAAFEEACAPYLAFYRS